MQILAPLLQALRQRHLETARQLLEDDISQIATKIDNSFHQLEDFLHGVAAVRELSPRSSDFLLSFGELISSEIVAAAFKRCSIDSVWVDSHRCVVTDATHTHAAPQMEETRKKAHKPRSTRFLPRMECQSWADLSQPLAKASPS